jgi:hypothetical protein
MAPKYKMTSNNYFHTVLTHTFICQFISHSHKRKPGLADEFRKPIWTEGYDTDDDDELFENNSKMFGFQMFTNPLELQKHFDKQMLEMLKALEEEGKYFTACTNHSRV